MLKALEAIYENGNIQILDQKEKGVYKAIVLLVEQIEKDKKEKSIQEEYIERPKDFDALDKHKNLFSEQEKVSLEHIVRDVREFTKEEVTEDAKQALRELCTGIFESEEDLASNHDFFLYGAPKRK